MSQEKSAGNKNKLQASHIVLLGISIFSLFLYVIFIFNLNNVSNWWLYGILIFTEIYIILQTLGIWWTTFYSSENPRDHYYYDLRKKIIADGEVEGGVDVFITSYGEDLATIYKTLKAARDMHIKHNTFALDDGKSQNVKQIAESLGVTYVARPDNKHAKAGNLNHALREVASGRFFCMFDADFVPKKHFLVETLPFFHDDKVAFVQTPQVLKNRNNIFAAGSSDSQKVFYDLVGGGKNRFNSMFWVGTNAMFRRAPIDDMGGIVHHNSEDIFTAYRLHQKGYKSIYIPDTLAIGVAPDNLGAYMKQQLRWAGGGFDMFFNENPLFTKLSADQKIQYFITSLFYFSGFVILASMLLPLIYIYFNIKPIDSDPIQWLISYVPFFLFQFIMILILSGRFSWQSYILSINSFPAYILAFWKVATRQKIKWVSTGTIRGGSKLEFLWPHMLILLVSVLAIPLAFLNQNIEVGTTIISMFWIGLNIVSISTFIFLSYTS